MIAHRIISRLDLDQACRVNDSVVQEHDADDGKGARHIASELGVDLNAVQVIGAELAGRMIEREAEAVEYGEAVQLVSMAYTMGVLTALRATHLVAREHHG